MTRHDEPAEGDVAGVALLDTMRAHLMTAMGSPEVRFGQAKWMTDRVVNNLADALRNLTADAWDEGHRTRQKLGDDDCRCGAWSAIECACGKYGSNVITPNPYRATERAQ